MDRLILKQLQHWLTSPQRKPLVIRGARQVGKTWVVRQLAQLENKTLIELNFERTTQLASLFESNDPEKILFNIEALYNQKIDRNNTILFLDEIQAAPEILSKLRWFAEELPELPVIAAGSLLEFVLASHTFSMPVGRISYLHLEPLSFEEYLLAQNKEQLFEYIAAVKTQDKIPPIIHQELMTLFKEYTLIGGMPAVVSSWAQNKNLEQISQLQHDLLATYRDDFAKYSGRLSIERLDEILLNIPKILGEKFVYSKINKDVSSQTIKNALQLLTKARLCHTVISCHANGIPLAAQVREKFFKVILLDVGLASAILGLKLHQVQSTVDINLINQGGISEQVVGQLLRTLAPYYIEPELYYWVRESKGSQAEVDYVIQHNNQVIPIEVKSGSTGSLKSLHLFMQLKKLDNAVRINSDLPSLMKIDHYHLLSIPFYLIGQLHRLLNNN